MHSEKVKNKIYTNLFLILIIFGIAYLFIYPIYSGKGSIYKPKKSISALLEDKKNIQNAIEIMKDYNKKIYDTNVSYVNALNTLPIDQLNRILPTSADPVLITYELTKIAARPESGMILSSPRFTDNGAGQPNTNKKFNTISITFTVQGTYENLKSFLKNIESSERIYNVTSLSFSSTEESKAFSVNKYSINVETYYLKNN